MLNLKSLSLVCGLLVLGACGVTIERHEALQKEFKQCTSDLNQASSTATMCQGQLKTVTVTTEELTTKTKTYEDLVGSLKDEISQGKIKISQIEDKLSVNLIDKILFDVGSASIGSEGKAVLKKIGGVLKTIKDKRVQVEGHTDDSKVNGGKTYSNNWELSVLRATSVVKFLAQSGLAESKLSAAGYSQYMPVHQMHQTTNK